MDHVSHPRSTLSQRPSVGDVEWKTLRCDIVVLHIYEIRLKSAAPFYCETLSGTRARRPDPQLETSSPRRTKIFKNVSSEFAKVYGEKNEETSRGSWTSHVVVFGKQASREQRNHAVMILPKPYPTSYANRPRRLRRCHMVVTAIDNYQYPMSQMAVDIRCWNVASCEQETAEPIVPINLSSPQTSEGTASEDSILFKHG